MTAVAKITDEVRADRDIANANQAYGALTEGLYITAFTFERAMSGVIGLLKGGGWRLCGAGFDDVNAFVRSLKLDQFKVVADQRQQFAKLVKECEPEVSNRAIATALGVDHQTINNDTAGEKSPRDVQKAAENGKAGGEKSPLGASDGRRDAALIGNRGNREERREEKLASVATTARLSGNYSVIYADPPWEDDFGHSGRDTKLHYPTMTLDKIKALPIESISTDDAVLYLWALPHMIPKALEVVEAWGFEYRTQMIWGKDKIGLGEWVRQQHEVLLIGRRGAFPPPPTAVRSPSLVIAPRGKHSAKPDVFAELIERFYPDLPKIELFRRGPSRNGWSSWGNEAREEVAPPELAAPLRRARPR
jgi:N6-adenosine-specific RNA methylase IME4